MDSLAKAATGGSEDPGGALVRSLFGSLTARGRAFLRFEAVNYRAWVYVNGKEAGRHEGGFTPFVVEVTDLLREGEITFRGTPEEMLAARDPYIQAFLS